MLVAAAAVVALCPAAGAAPATAQDSRERQRLEQERLRLDAQRLQFEVNRLRRESSLQGDVLRWLPAIVAVAALFGVFRYLDERRVAREVRVEEGVGRNLERLVDRSSSEASRSARVLVALRNLDGIAPRRDGRSRGRGRRSKAAASHRAQVTEAVEEVVRGPDAYLSADDARVPTICLEHWEEFSESCRGQRELPSLIVSRYVIALKRLTEDVPRYVKTARREGSAFVSAERANAEQQQLFGVMAVGLERFTALAAPLDPRISRELSDVAPALAAQLGGE